MTLAAEFGGGPAYWGLPERADEDLVETAARILVDRADRVKDR